MRRVRNAHRFVNVGTQRAPTNQQPGHVDQVSELERIEFEKFQTRRTPDEIFIETLREHRVARFELAPADKKLRRCLVGELLDI